MAKTRPPCSAILPGAPGVLRGSDVLCSRRGCGRTGIRAPEDLELKEDPGSRITPRTAEKAEPCADNPREAPISPCGPAIGTSH